MRWRNLVNKQRKLGIFHEEGEEGKHTQSYKIKGGRKRWWVDRNDLRGARFFFPFLSFVSRYKKSEADSRDVSLIASEPYKSSRDHAVYIY